MIRKDGDGYWDLLTGLKIKDLNDLNYDQDYAAIVKEVDDNLNPICWHWVGEKSEAELDPMVILREANKRTVEVGDQFKIGELDLKIVGFNMWMVIVKRI